MKTIINKIENWARNVGLAEKDIFFPDVEIKKVFEEVTEVRDELNKIDDLRYIYNFDDMHPAIMDLKSNLEMEVGDVFVALVVLCMQEGVNIMDGINRAYEKILSRDGELINGDYIPHKEEA